MPLAAFEEMPVSSAFLMAVLFIDLYCRELRALRRMMAARTVLDVCRTAEVAAMSGRALSRTFVTATVLLLLDAFTGILGFAGLMAFGAVLGGIPRALLAWQREDTSTARLRIARTGIYVAVGLLSIGAYSANESQGRGGELAPIRE